MQGHVFYGSSCDCCNFDMLCPRGVQAAANRSQHCNRSIRDKIPHNFYLHCILLQMRRFRNRAGRNMASRQSLPNRCKQGSDFEEQSHLQNPTGSDSEQLQQNLPIHERRLQVDPQKNSPLYDGTIPAEIRDQIFCYSVQEFFKTNSSSIWPLDTNYTRPGYSGLRKVDISLLLTCRKVYLETYHLQVLAKEHYFFHGSWTGPPPRGHYASQPFDYESELDYFVKLQPWQLSLIK